MVYNEHESADISAMYWFHIFLSTYPEMALLGRREIFLMKHSIVFFFFKFMFPQTVYKCSLFFTSVSIFVFCLPGNIYSNRYEMMSSFSFSLCPLIINVEHFFVYVNHSSHLLRNVCRSPFLGEIISFICSDVWVTHIFWTLITYITCKYFFRW